MKKKKTKKTKRAPGKRAGSGAKKGWTVGDFVNSVWKTMEEQARENESLKDLHARLSPEWNRVSRLVGDLLSENDRKAVNAKIEDIERLGERAVRPLIDIVLKLGKRD